MSNRLTFSLASLTLIFALAFVAMPAMAATGGPTVADADFVEYTGKVDGTSGAADYKKTRADFRVKVTFSHSVSGFDAGADATAELYDINGGQLSDTPAITITALPFADAGATPPIVPDGKQYMLTVGAITNDAATTVRIVIPDDQAEGNTLANRLGVAGTSKSFGLPALIADTVSVALGAPAATTTPGQYTIDAVFTNNAEGATAVATLNPAFATSHVSVDPKTAATVSSIGTATDATAAPWTSTYEITVMLTHGQTTADISIDSSYIAGSNTVTVTSIMVLDAPMNLAATANDDRTVTLTWDAVTSADSYTITQMQAGEDDVTIENATSPHTTGALAVGDYSFTVMAVDDDGTHANSAASDPATATVSGTAPTVTVSLGSLDETAETFQVIFAFAKAGTAEAPVPSMLDPDHIKVTTDAAGMTDAIIADPMVATLRGDGNFSATIDYSTSDLPLYVSLIEADPDATPAVDGVTVSGITYAGMPADATALKVGEADDTGDDTVYNNPPAVTLEVTEHDADARSFRVEITTTPAADTAGEAGAAIAGADIKSALMVMDGSTPAVNVGVNILDGDSANERIADNSYRAFLEYSPFDALPLTVSIDPDDLITGAAPDAADTDPVEKEVGGDDTTDPTVNVPGAPTDLTATADQTANTIALSWTAPTDNGGADITGYTITQTGQAAATYTAAADATSHTTPALAAGDYSFTVKAMNSAGNSPASAAATATIDADGMPITDNTPPTLAANVGTADPTTGAVMVTLVFNEALSGTPTVTHVVTPASLATTYGVSAVTAGTAPNTYMVTVTPTAATVATGNLPAGTVTLTVTAMDAAGNALASPGNTVPVPLGARTYTPPSGNTPPTFVGTAIGDVYFWVGETGHMSPDLPLGKDDLTDTLTYSVSPALPAGLEAKQIDNNRYVIQGTPTTAQAQQSYDWIVTDSVGQIAKSPFTITIVARLKPGKVMGLTAMQVSHTPNAETVDLAWNKLAVRMKTDANNMGNDGGSAVTSYSIMWESEQGNTGTILHQATPLTEAYTFKLPAYLPIGEYEFMVAATNAVGTGDYSEAVKVNVANPPSAPYDLEASIDQVSNRVTLSWKAGFHGGDPITGYVAYIWAPNSQVPVRKVTGSTTTTYRTDSLTVEGTYVFRVSAINGCGEGLQSDAQPLAVVLSPNQPPVWVDPNASIDDVVATVGVPIAPIALPNATDPEGEAIRYSIRPLLPGLTDFFRRCQSGEPGTRWNTDAG